MLVAALLTILGLTAGIVLVERTGIRMGGVIVVPLMAIYTLYSVVALPLFVLSVVVAILGVGVLNEKTLIHGRAQLLASLAIGAIVPLLATGAFGLLNVSDAAEVAFVSTILPGLAAYNYHQLEPEKRVRDVALSGGVLVGLCVVGTILISPTAADVLPTPLTSVLFTPESDIASLRGATTGTVPGTTLLSSGGMLAIIAFGMAGVEAAHARYGLRLGGLIAIPLVVVLALTNWWALPVYMVGVAVLFGATAAFHRLTLVYGRVLLSVSLITAMLYATVIAALGGAIPISGFQLYFASMLAGIGAYNFHLVAPGQRPEAAALAAALFVILIGLARVVVSPTETGALVSFSIIHLIVATVVFMAAAAAIVELEGQRDMLAAYRMEVFNR